MQYIMHSKSLTLRTAAHRQTHVQNSTRKVSRLTMQHHSLITHITTVNGKQLFVQRLEYAKKSVTSKIIFSFNLSVLPSSYVTVPSSFKQLQMPYQSNVTARTSARSRNILVFNIQTNRRRSCYLPLSRTVSKNKQKKKLVLTCYRNCRRKKSNRCKDLKETVLACGGLLLSVLRCCG